MHSLMCKSKTTQAAKSYEGWITIAEFASPERALYYAHEIVENAFGYFCNTYAENEEKDIETSLVIINDNNGHGDWLVKVTGDRNRQVAEPLSDKGKKLVSWFWDQQDRNNSGN